MKKTLFAVFSFLSCAQCAFAQQDTLNSISAKPIEGGKIFSAYKPQLTGAFYGFAVGYQRSMARSQADWVRIFRIQDVSYEASYLNLHGVSLAGMPDTKGMLGSAYGLSARLDALLFSMGTVRVIFSPGIGLEYLTQTFHTNGNMIVGSHLNLAVQAGVKVQAPVSSSMKIQFEINASHISDVGTVKPNCGINMGAASLGIVQAIGTAGPPGKKAAFETNTKGSLELDAVIGSTGRIRTGYFWNKETGQGIYDTTGRKKLAADSYQLNVYAGYNVPISRVLSIKAGTDLAYYSKLFSYDNFLGSYQGTSSSYAHLSAGVSAGAEIWMERITFSFSYGYFAYEKFLLSQKTYWNFGVKYYLAPGIALNAKAFMHGGEPNAGFGIACTIK